MLNMELEIILFYYYYYYHYSVIATPTKVLNRYLDCNTKCFGLKKDFCYFILISICILGYVYRDYHHHNEHS